MNESLSVLTDGPESAVRTVTRARWTPRGVHADEDEVVVEEPLEIRVGPVPIAVLMRTPGHDIDLTYGFMLTERIFPRAEDIARVAHCTQGEQSENVAIVTPAPTHSLDLSRFVRGFYTTSSCGVCGKRSIERALDEAPPLTQKSQFKAALLAKMPALLSSQQPIFGRTGGIHAAALFSADGKLECVREDIGRHNAVDKVVGWALRSGAELGSYGLVVSGRASYEIVQKALAARISCIVAVGGASSLAIDLAERGGILLAAFARPEHISVYSDQRRVS
jgi:FdhD protein